MQLYYVPGACSLAPHIVVSEGGLDVGLNKVAFGAQRTTQDGRDFYSVNPMGAVPALEIKDGEVLTENAVLLQYLADLKPEAKLGPPATGLARWHFLEELNFIATELHKGFSILFANPPEEFKAKHMEKLKGRLVLLEQHLGAKQYLNGDQFSILDAYAFTMLTWARKFGVPATAKLDAYFDRVKARPGVAKALSEEGLSF